MIKLVERKPDGHYMNEEPIANAHEALDALVSGQHDSREGRYIDLHPRGGGTPELCVGWFADGDSGGASSGFHYWQIKPEVIKELQEKGWIEPKQIPTWGRTDTDHNKLVLSRDGKEELVRFTKEQREVARKLPVAGVHSKYSGIFEDAGYGRDGYNCGKLYFEFVTPIKERVRVYPDTKEVLKLEPEKV